MKNHLPAPFDAFTRSDWDHVRETVAGQRADYEPFDEEGNDAESPEECVMTSLGYVDVGLDDDGAYVKVTQGARITVVAEEDWPTRATEEAVQALQAAVDEHAGTMCDAVRFIADNGLAAAFIAYVEGENG